MAATLVPLEQRRAVLDARGAPAVFLDALDAPEQLGELRQVIQGPDAAYYYLPDILDQSAILDGCEVTPVCDGINGDSFYVHLANALTSRFVYFVLEVDEIYRDFGASFRLLFADLLIELYEFADETPIEELSRVGERLGLPKASRLLRALEEADRSGARRTMELDDAWREKRIPDLVADS